MRPTPVYTTTPLASDAATDAGLRSYMLGVYKEMGIALGISGVVAAVLGRDLSALRRGGDAILPDALYAALYTPPLSWLVMFAPLIAVLFISFRIHAMAPATARLALYGFATLMGVSLASIFAIYTGFSIAQAFFATAAGMAGLALYGYTTQRNLSGWGSFLMMGVIALIVASIANIFIGAPALSFAVSALAVLIFSALMAYDTQRVKTDYLALRGSVPDTVLSTMGTAGALSMYLNFVNVFVSLLNLFGNRE